MTRRPLLAFCILLPIAVISNACVTESGFATVEPTQDIQEVLNPDEDLATETAPIKQSMEISETGEPHAPTPEEEHSRNGSTYWVEMEDPHYGIRCATPCLEPFYDHCQVVNEPKIRGSNVLGMNQEEIALLLFEQYLEGYQGSVVPASCKLRSFKVEEVSIDPTLMDFAEERGVDMMAWATYSVQATAPGFWIAGNGVSDDDGWVLDKSMIVGLTKVGDVFKLTLHGTGP
ncbi:MAG: hypothetical protein PVF74_06645 [Anaerolineales bacterium]